MSLHALPSSVLASVLSVIICAPVASADTFLNASNKGTVFGPSNSAVPLSPSVKTVQAPLESASDSLSGPVRTLPNLSPRQDWAPPVNDQENHLFTLFDVLEYRPKTTAGEHSSDYRWDIEGWYGGDYNRLWFKSEGQQNSAFKADYHLDFQLLYGRFLRKYYDFQIGPRLETQTFRGKNVTRGFAAIGIEGIVPYDYTMEATLFIDQNGAVSGRLTLTKDVLLTQRLILQGRFETNVAVQRVEEFTTGPGLNNLEFGMRLRYEIRREFAPYVGFSLDRSFGETATLVRQENGNPSQIRFVAGVRMWF
ncbi:MAG: copper resistance protein B [Nitrospiraceae bacterium]|jgi:copper resistance protein B|nr:copper resistance protein B [Nitrospiraceae bacterium]